MLIGPSGCASLPHSSLCLSNDRSPCSIARCCELLIQNHKADYKPSQTNRCGEFGGAVSRRNAVQCGAKNWAGASSIEHRPLPTHQSYTSNRCIRVDRAQRRSQSTCTHAALDRQQAWHTSQSEHATTCRHVQDVQMLHLAHSGIFRLMRL